MNNIKTVSFISTLVLLVGCLNYSFAGDKELKTDTNRDVRKEYKAFKGIISLIDKKMEEVL